MKSLLPQPLPDYFLFFLFCETDNRKLFCTLEKTDAVTTPGLTLADLRLLQRQVIFNPGTKIVKETTNPQRNINKCNKSYCSLQ